MLWPQSAFSFVNYRSCERSCDTCKFISYIYNESVGKPPWTVFCALLDTWTVRELLSDAKAAASAGVCDHWEKRPDGWLEYGASLPPGSSQHKHAYIPEEELQRMRNDVFHKTSGKNADDDERSAVSS